MSTFIAVIFTWFFSVFMSRTLGYSFNKGPLIIPINNPSAAVGHFFSTPIVRVKRQFTTSQLPFFTQTSYSFYSQCTPGSQVGTVQATSSTGVSTGATTYSLDPGTGSPYNVNINPTSGVLTIILQPTGGFEVRVKATNSYGTADVPVSVFCNGYNSAYSSSSYNTGYNPYSTGYPYSTGSTYNPYSTSSSFNPYSTSSTYNPYSTGSTYPYGTSSYPYGSSVFQPTYNSGNNFPYVTTCPQTGYYYNPYSTGTTTCTGTTYNPSANVFG